MSRSFNIFTFYHTLLHPLKLGYLCGGNVGRELTFLFIEIDSSGGEIELSLSSGFCWTTD